MRNGIYRELGFKNLLTSKKNNIVLGFSITLVSAFLMTILGLCYSLNLAFKEDLAVNGFGADNAYFSLKDEEDISRIKNHTYVDEVGENIIGGQIIEYKGSKIYLNYSDKTWLDFYRTEILSGELPNDKYDIVLEDKFCEKYKLNIGDYITNEKGEEFKITGIVNVKGNPAPNSYDGYVTKEIALRGETLMVNGKDARYSVGLTVKGKFNIEKKLYEIAEDLGYTPCTIFGEENGDFIINEFMLGPEKGIVVAFFILTLLIVLTSFFIIYNLVSINFTERVQNYGLLSTLGMNRKQLTKVMWWEVFILSIIAIPIGIVVGVGVGKIIIPRIPVNLDVPLHVVYKLWFIPVIIFITLITVFVSILAPVRKNIKMSPIEAMNYSSFSMVKEVKFKESNNVLNDLAKSNILRNKRATMTIIISLSISAILFLAVSTVLNSMSLQNYIRSSFVAEDIKVAVNNDMSYYMDGGITEKSAKDIINYSDVKYAYGNKKVGSYIGDKSYDLYSINSSDLKNLDDNLIEGSLDKNEYDGKNKVIIPYKNDVSEIPYKVGDKVEIKVNDEIDSYEVGAIVNGFDIMTTVKANNNILLYEGNKSFDNVDYFVFHIKTKGGKVESVKQRLFEEYKSNGNIELTTYDGVNNEQSNSLKQLNFGGYLIVSVIGILGVLNYIITILTSVLSRRKEFGIIRALGIREKELRKMIIREGIFISGIIGSIGIILGNILGYYLYIAFKTQAAYAIYSFPIIQNVIVVLLLIVIPLLVYRMAIKSIVKIPVVEQIRYIE